MKTHYETKMDSHKNICGSKLDELRLVLTSYEEYIPNELMNPIDENIIYVFETKPIQEEPECQYMEFSFRKKYGSNPLYHNKVINYSGKIDQDNLLDLLPRNHAISAYQFGAIYIVKWHILEAIGPINLRLVRISRDGSVAYPTYDIHGQEPMSNIGGCSGSFTLCGYNFPVALSAPNKTVKLVLEISAVTQYNTYWSNGLFSIDGIPIYENKTVYNLGGPPYYKRIIMPEFELEYQLMREKHFSESYYVCPAPIIPIQRNNNIVLSSSNRVDKMKSDGPAPGYETWSLWNGYPDSYACTADSYAWYKMDYDDTLYININWTGSYFRITSTEAGEYAKISFDLSALFDVEITEYACKNQLVPFLSLVKKSDNKNEFTQYEYNSEGIMEPKGNIYTSFVPVSDLPTNKLRYYVNDASTYKPFIIKIDTNESYWFQVHAPVGIFDNNFYNPSRYYGTIEIEYLSRIE